MPQGTMGQSASSAYWVSPDPRRLTSTSAVNVTGGVIGGAGGVANDSILTYVYIPQATTAITLTVAGFQDEAGNAVSLVFEGDTTQDMEFHPHIVNSKGAMTLTASVASKVLVGTRPP